MSRVLLRKLIGLGRDEDGAALVITLALLMFMYLTCAGVFAIGQSVKDKIHLQNACDAAAYSAAVVQADTLSRIATINKAMAWTYVSMTRRQMDCIVYRWLEHSIAHYDLDEETARAWYRESHCGAHHMSDLVLNGHESGAFVQSRQRLKEKLKKFSSQHLNKRGNIDSFYSEEDPLDIDKLQAQIGVDKSTIREMNAAEIRLIDGGDGCPSLRERMNAVATEILRSNLQNVQNYRYFIADANMGGFDSDQCFKEYGKYLTLANSEYDEQRFLAWIDKGTPKSEFKSGTDVWFCRDGGLGLHRAYLKGIASNPLYATWDWWTWRCNGHDAYGAPIRVYRAAAVTYPDYQQCDHVYRRCWCESNTHYNSPVFRDGAPKYSIRTPLSYSAISYADTIYGDKTKIYFDGERAYPLILSAKYFGAAGTYTVGLAKYNENPWYRVFGDMAAAVSGAGDKLGGIFAAFNPHRSVEWTWAVSSAKAGYRHKNEEYDGTRAYCVDWSDDQEWNLCVSDWDAVFVPVRSARMKAENRFWVGNGNEDFLRTWIEDGDWQTFDGGSSRHGYAVAGKMTELPQMHNSGGGLIWKDLADLLYH